MKPGRDLDILVAEKVMGWTSIEENRHSHTSSTQITGYDPNVEPSPYTGARPRYTVPKYSTDIKDAWEVVDKFKWAEPEISWSDEQHCWHAIFWKGRNSGTSSSRISAPHAICLAALKAHGVEIDE